MKTSTIVTIVLVILLLYIIIKWMTSKVVQLCYKTSTNVVIPSIEGKKLGKEQGANFTYSIWIYISNWKNSEHKKIILQRKNSKNPSLDPEPDGTNDNDLEIYLGKYKNTLTTAVKCYQDVAAGGVNELQKCHIDEIPIQKWVNIIISVYGKTLDTYINGKLERTCILPNVVEVKPDAPLQLGPLHQHPNQPGNVTWDGWIANARYYMYYVNPQEAWNIYKEGYSPGSLGGLFDKYKIKFSFLVDDQVKSSFMI